MTDRCRYERINGERTLMPGCIGAAIHGKPGCTCGSSKEALRERVERLEAMYRSLCDKVQFITPGEIERIAAKAVAAALHAQGSPNDRP